MLNIKFVEVNDNEATLVFSKEWFGWSTNIFPQIDYSSFCPIMDLFMEAFYWFYENGNKLRFKEPYQFCNIRWFRALKQLKKYGWIKVYRENNKMIYEIPIYRDGV